MTRRVWTGAAVAAAVALLAVLTPAATHGAFSATEQMPAASARLNPWFGCTALAAGTADSAVFDYGLDDATGATTAPDLSGHGATGQYSPAARTVHDPAAPCRWDGDLVLAPAGAADLTSPAIRLPTNFAYETWFRTASPNRILMTIELPGFGSVGLVVDASGGLVVAGVGGEYVRNTASVADDRWHHLVLEAGNGSIGFQLDGVVLPATPGNVPDGLTVVIHVGSGDLSNGPSTVSSARPFDGELRTAVLYNRVLSPTEAGQHRAAGLATRPVAPPVPDPGPSTTAPSTTPTQTPTATATATPVQTAAPVSSASATSLPERSAPAETAQPVAQQPD